MITARLGLLSIGALVAVPSAAEADVIAATGLDQSIASNSTYNVSINGVSSFSITNDFYGAGSDYYGNSYYGKYVNIAGVGTSLVGSPVAPGVTPSAPAFSSEQLSSQSVSWYQAQVGSYFGGYGSCGKDCSYPIYYPIYGTFGTYNYSGQTGELYVPVSIVSQGTTEFGFIDLTITNPGTNVPYNVTLNGYEFQTDGSPLAADFAAAVPEPSTWFLMALGFAGIGLSARRSKRQLAMI